VLLSNVNAPTGSEVKTTVPTGATTGSVEVTTPKKTVKSNVSFSGDEVMVQRVRKWKPPHVWAAFLLRKPKAVLPSTVVIRSA